MNFTTRQLKWTGGILLTIAIGIFLWCNLERYEFTAEVMQKTFVPAHWEYGTTIDAEGNITPTSDYVPDKYIIHARDEEGGIFQRHIGKDYYFSVNEGDWVTLHSVRWKRKDPQ